MAQCNLTIHVKLPWWKGIYFQVFAAMHRVGAINANPDAVSGFILSWSKYRVGENGRWKWFGEE